MSYRWVAWRQSKHGFGKWHLVPADMATIPGSQISTVCGKMPQGTPAIGPPKYDRRSTPKEACGTCVLRAHHWGPPEPLRLA